MDGLSDTRANAPLQNQVMPASLQSKISEAVAEAMQRHSQQMKWEEKRPRHSHPPYERRHPSAEGRSRDWRREEEAGHRRSEATRRDYHQTEEYDPRGNEIEDNYLKLVCPQGFKFSPSSLAAFLDNLSI